MCIRDRHGPREQARHYLEVNLVMDARRSCRSGSVWDAKLSCFKRDVGSFTEKK